MTGFFGQAISNVLRAVISKVDDSDSIQTLQLRLNAKDVRDGTPRAGEFGHTSSPPIGSVALFVCAGGDRSKGVVVGIEDPKTRPTGLASGESMLYSAIGQRVYLSATGIVIEAKGLPVTINDATDVTCNCTGVFKVVAPGGVEFVTPTVKSSGDIVDNAESNGQSMKSMREIYDTHTHKVQEVESGGATIESDVPTEQI